MPVRYAKPAAGGDGWACACQNFSAIAPEDTKRALADPATQRFTPASIAGALEKWNARMRASGADCDCSAYSGGEHAEERLARLVDGLEGDGAQRYDERQD